MKVIRLTGQFTVTGFSRQQIGCLVNYTCNELRFYSLDVFTGFGIYTDLLPFFHE
ncbi:hypothetical protein SAMN05660909_01520 [Chitinophaga terrae (ex Kim and Jung 2007)]|uniref:Uncharacterized protein n=1 Tax=Chitinophaga terrae (ex Kim and Jung 2007) TaxID=408074 RepID=A0A1H4A749_9BACT|nr:hypothetical protein [Chitinophaga terrae (ex Kim and Jung 2007)]SEA31953.1 hypothetical protein SAMN05660909_01520 [Chitinophaga terrae (ex Kim and Jung 2007)]